MCVELRYDVLICSSFQCAPVESIDVSACSLCEDLESRMHVRDLYGDEHGL